MTNDAKRKRRKGKILFIHRYIRPDVPMYGWMLPEIAEAVSGLGYRVDIFSTIPSYRNERRSSEHKKCDNRGLVRIYRIRLPSFLSGDLGKLLSGIWLTLRAFMRVLFGRYRLVMTATTPPVILAYGISLVARLRGIGFVYHYQDIHPEISKGQGPFRFEFIYKIFVRLDKKSCKRAKNLIVLSEDMKHSLVNLRSVNEEKIRVINNFVFKKPDINANEIENQVDGLLAGGSKAFRFVFSGNLGRFQGLTDILDAMSVISTERAFELILVGSGQAESALRDQVNAEGLPVRFLGQQPKEVADAVVRRCDIAIISLRTNLIRYAYPSKTLDYLTAGMRVLAIVDTDSSLADLIASEGIGCVASPGDISGIARAMEESLESGASNDMDKRRISNLASELYGRNVALSRWINAYRTLLESGKS